MVFSTLLSEEPPDFGPITNGQREKIQQAAEAITTLQRQLAEANNRIGDLEGNLIHIAEYWNRDPNETAMSDALWHIIEVVDAALTEGGE